MRVGLQLLTVCSSARGVHRCCFKLVIKGKPLIKISIPLSTPKPREKKKLLAFCLLERTAAFGQVSLCFMTDLLAPGSIEESIWSPEIISEINILAIPSSATISVVVARDNTLSSRFLLNVMIWVINWSNETSQINFKILNKWTVNSKFQSDINNLYYKH